MTGKEVKYFVLKLEDIEGAGIESHLEALCKVVNDYRKINNKGPIEENRYIVCNQDEPYSEAVWKTILDGERAKETDYKGGNER